MSATMLSYRLPNGTHVLIHQTALQEKSDEGVPFLFVEDGQGDEQELEEGSATGILLPGVEVGIEPQEVALVEEDCQNGSPNQEEVKSDIDSEKVMESVESEEVVDNLDHFAEMVMWYKCRMCTFAASQREQLLDHLKSHHLKVKDKPVIKVPAEKDLEKSEPTQTAPTEENISEKLVFLCGQCNGGFSSLDSCKQHMMQDHDLIVHEGEEPKETPEQASTSETVKRKVRLPKALEREFWLGQKSGQDAPTLKCCFHGCQLKFNSDKALEVHFSCHMAGSARDYQCCECQNPFDKWRNCALHLWKTHEIDAGLLTCPICHSYKSVTAVPMDNHMRIHKETRDFQCPECGKGFKQASQLHNHRVMHLDRKSNDLPKWFAAKRCDICFKNYADSKCLKKHIQAVHRKLRPYVCQVCGHASARKAMLQMHYRQHTGEKPHSCPLCEYRTGDHNSLRRHLMRHTGQRPYRCPHCSYSAIQSNCYKNHLRSKHPGQAGLFCCTDCSFKTVSHESFLLHTSDHKNGIITSSSTEGSNEVEVFPGNVAAAHLIYRCLNALSPDGNALEANVTGSSTSADGTTQTITIQIPTQDCNNDEPEEEETTRCFIEIQQSEEEEEGVDTGGITIPAEPEQNIVCNVAT